MSAFYRPIDNVQSKTSAYDRLSAWLAAMLMLVGFLVATLFLIWLTSVFNFDNRVAVKIDNSEQGIDGNDQPEGFEDDALDPGVEDFAEVETPQLAEALEAVSNAVSNIRANPNKVSGDAAAMGTGGGFGNRDGGPSGDGDVISDEKRWKISFETDSVGTYKRLLDFFNLQVALLSKQTTEVWTVENVSTSADVAKSDRQSKRQSGYIGFFQVKPRLRRWDQQICSGAGVSIDGNAQGIYMPPATRAIVKRVEAEYLASVGKELREVLRTNLRVEESGGGFQFVVQGCDYR